MTHCLRYAARILLSIFLYASLPLFAEAAITVTACDITISANKASHLRTTAVCDAARAVEDTLGGTLGGSKVFVAYMARENISAFPELAYAWESSAFESSIAKLLESRDLVYEGRRFHGGIIQVIPQADSWEMILVASHEFMHELYMRIGIPAEAHHHHCEMFFGSMEYGKVLARLAPQYQKTSADIARTLEDKRSQYREYCQHSAAQ